MSDTTSAYRNLPQHRESGPESSFNNPVLASFRETSDEVWSDYTSHMFALCDYMYSRYPDDIQSHWGYSASPFAERGGPVTDEEDYPLCYLLELEPTAEQCVKAGNVLDRYGDMLRRLGLDY